MGNFRNIGNIRTVGARPRRVSVGATAAALLVVAFTGAVFTGSAGAASSGSSGSSGSSETPVEDPSSLPALIGEDLALSPLGSALVGGPSEALRSSGSSLSPGSSDPIVPGDGESEIREVRHVEGDRYQFDVFSGSMDRVVTNDILLPGGLDNTEPRPTFYLMMGADGAAGGAAWGETTDYEAFFADKNVNVVTPRGSVSSMQADWLREDPTTGTNLWTTYMTEELPPLVDDYFHGTGRDAIAGVSMSGGPAVNIAGRYPERFVAAGSYSGCPATTGLAGYLFSAGAVELNDGSSTNMWGVPGSGEWVTNSPVLHLDRLDGLALYVSAAHGIAPDTAASSDRLSPNGIEILSYMCSSYFADRAGEAGLAVDWDPRVTGNHGWDLFESQLYRSWDTIGPALGVE